MAALSAEDRDIGSAPLFHARKFLLGGLYKVVLALTGLAGVIGLWWLISAGTISARVPTPPEVVAAIQRDFWDIKALEYMLFTTGGIYQHLSYTFANVIIAVTMGTLAGVGIGVLISRVQTARGLLEAPLLFMGTFPVVMLLPFFTMWFGTARLAQNGLVLFYSFMTVALVARQATMNISGHFEQYAISLGARPGRFLVRVILPAIVPEVIGAVRVSLAAGWGFETVAEILGAPAGAGRLIQVFSVAVMTPDIFGVLVCVGVLAVVVDAAVAGVGKWLVRWQE